MPGTPWCHALALPPYRLKDVQSMDEWKDVYNHFLLYYGRDIPKMQNAAKANRKKHKRVREDGEDEEGQCSLSSSIGCSFKSLYTVDSCVPLG